MGGDRQVVARDDNDAGLGRVHMDPDSFIFYKSQPSPNPLGLDFSDLNPDPLGLAGPKCVLSFKFSLHF